MITLRLKNRIMFKKNIFDKDKKQERKKNSKRKNLILSDF